MNREVFDGHDCQHGSVPTECAECLTRHLLQAYGTCELLAEHLAHICLVLKGPTPPGRPAYTWADLPALVAAQNTVVQAASLYMSEHPRTRRSSLKTAVTAWNAAMQRSLLHSLD